MNAARWRIAGIASVCVLLAALLVAVGFLGRMVLEPQKPTIAAVPEGTDVDPEIINEIIAILGEDFVEPDRATPELLFDGAIQGIFSEGLNDPHSGYISPRDYQLARDDFSGGFQGIGATVQQQEDYVVIQRTLPGTPAERAGLRAGDVILSVNGEDAAGWSVQQAVLKIRGPRGTEVELRVRHGDRTEETFKLKRDDVLVASVSVLPPGGVLKDASGTEATDISYIHIGAFTSRTPKELTDLINEANRAGKKGLILDVRGNPGGLLSETAQIADFFLDNGVIVSQVDRDGREQRIDARPGQLTQLPVVIVQDQESASGSEVLAAALRDNGRAKVVGTRSFGKGAVNHYRELSNGGAVYVSIARWLTPLGEQIEGQGVPPDVEVVATQTEDVPVFRAIDLLRSGQAAAGPRRSS
jgi:carboxyl-terminal processing protease